MTIYQYDINSAYANTYRNLPCLVHGSWRAVKSMPKSGLFLCEIEFQHSDKFTWCVFPIRMKNGSIVFPLAGAGVYWSYEIEIARKYGVKMKFIRGWKYSNQCDCESFRFIDDMYAMRRKLGKNGRGMVLKTTLASAYGKLTQSVGCAPFSNPIWAGLITSQVRAQLIDATLMNGNYGADVVMLATDGLFCTEPRDLPVGPELGQWDLTEHESMFIVQSGVYFLPDKMPKTRGVPMGKVVENEQEFRQVWDEFLATGELRPVVVSLNNFIGLKLALARNNLSLAGQWVDVEKNITFDFYTKRVDPKVIDRKVVTNPIPGSTGFQTIPYSRIIGGLMVRQRLGITEDTSKEEYGLRAQHRIEFEEQPDWGDVL